MAEAEVDTVSFCAMDGNTAKRTLLQIGWFNERTRFMSLNLTPEQFDSLTDAAACFPLATPEQLIVRACEAFVQQAKAGAA